MTLPLADPNFAEATWILVVKSIVIFAVVMAIVPLLTVVERKVLGRFQHRYGPNRVGPVGLLQPLADAVKLISKEHYEVTGFNRLVRLAYSMNEYGKQRSRRMDEVIVGSSETARQAPLGVVPEG